MGYEKIVGIVRAKEEILFKRMDWERLISITSARNLWNELGRLGRGYKDIGHDHVIEHVSDAFNKNIINLYDEISNYFEDDENLRISLFLEFDVYNLKLLFKEKKFSLDLKNKRIESGYYGINDLTDYPCEFEKVLEILKADVTEISSKEFDLMLDDVLYQYRIDVSKENNFVLNFWKLKIDLINFKMNILAADTEKKNIEYIKNGNIDYSDWKNITDEVKLENIMRSHGYTAIYESAKNKNIDASKWEVLEEEFIFNYLDDAVMYCMSLEPIVAYFFKKLCEYKNINRLLYAKIFNMSDEYIHNNLSKCYT